MVPKNDNLTEIIYFFKLWVGLTLFYRAKLIVWITPKSTSYKHNIPVTRAWKILTEYFQINLWTRSVTYYYGTGSKGPMNWENHDLFFRKLGKTVHLSNEEQWWYFLFNEFAVILKIQCSLSLRSLISLIVMENWSWGSLLKSKDKSNWEFLTYNWEHTSLFALGNGADFRSQFVESDGPALDPVDVPKWTRQIYFIQNWKKCNSLFENIWLTVSQGFSFRIGWNWPSGSEAVENMKTFQTHKNQSHSSLERAY